MGVTELDGAPVVHVASTLPDGAPKDVLLKPEHPRLKAFVGRFHETADMLRPFLEAAQS